MPTWLKIVGGIFFVIAIIGVGTYLYLTASVDNQYDIIRKHWSSSGRYTDYANDVGVQDASDVVYYVDKDKKMVEIYYGYITLKYSFKDLATEEMKVKLREIGLTYEAKPDTGDDFKFYWQGVEMEKWWRSVSY